MAGTGSLDLFGQQFSAISHTVIVCVCVYRYLESDYRAEFSANASSWSLGVSWLRGHRYELSWGVFWAGKP